MSFIDRLLMSLCVLLLCTSGAALVGQEAEPFPEVVLIEQEAGNGFMENFAESIGYQSDEPYLYRIHNDAYYHLVAFSENGDVVQLHDASKWSVHSSQRNTVLYWVQSDDIFIKPKSSCFSSYRYVLHNRTTQQTVEVNMISPPLPMGAATFRIINIEPFQRLIQLNDNTVWQIDPKDPYFSSWQVGQRLLVGVDNHWRTAEMPHILINVDKYKEPYSSANFYGYAVGY